MPTIKKQSGSFPSNLQGTIVFSGTPGAFTVGETVTGSGFSAKVSKYNATSKTMVVKKIAGTPSGVLTGGSSSATGTVDTVTQATSGGIALNKGGWNIRETTVGVTRSKVIGSRTLVEVLLAQAGLSTARTDVSAAPTFTLTAFTSTGPYDVSAGNKILFTVTASEAINVAGNPTYGITVGGVSRTASFQSITGNVMTFGYTVMAADEGTDLALAAAAGDFAFPGTSSFSDLVAGVPVKMTGTIGATGTTLTQAAVTIQA